jgi:hypothetical protein
LTVKIICSERNFLDSFNKIFFATIFFGWGNRRDARASLPAGFENQDATVVQEDFWGFPWLRTRGFLTGMVLGFCAPMTAGVDGVSRLWEFGGA